MCRDLRRFLLSCMGEPPGGEVLDCSFEHKVLDDSSGVVVGAALLFESLVVPFSHRVALRFPLCAVASCWMLVGVLDM